MLIGLGKKHQKGIIMSYVYIMINKIEGVLYIGVTNNLVRRVYEHREGIIPGFTQKYRLRRLVYYQEYESLILAIQKEKLMKHWPRQWKLNAIYEFNPHWEDLLDFISA